MKLIEVGRIINTHGLKGEVKVLPFSDEPLRFKNYKTVFVKGTNYERQHSVTSVKTVKNVAVLKFEEVQSIEEAETLKGYLVYIEESVIPVLEEDSFYVKDLIDCSVFNEIGELLGTLKEVISTGSNDVYVVERIEKPNLLVPALKSVVLKVDISQKRVEVQLPKGLLEIYE